jgi:MFS family permease
MTRSTFKFFQRHHQYIGWGVLSLFFFYQYILRISPGIMVVELRQLFKLTAQEFSSLGAIYLYAYSLLQVPLGFLVDRLGVRRVIGGAIMVCALGTVIFACATHLWMLQVGRLLIGIGSAPAFLCAIKWVTDHCPLKYRGLLMGATLSIGTIGAFISGKFYVELLHRVTWQNSLYISALLGLVIFILVALFIKKDAANNTHHDSPAVQLKQGLKIILGRPEIVLYSIIAISVYTPLCILADLWGTAFMMQKFSLPRDQAAQVTLSMYAGLTVGSLILPWLSVHFHKLKEVILLCSFGLIACLLILLFGGEINTLALVSILTTIGFLCGAEMICFTGAVMNVHAAHTGLALGIVNTMNMLGGAFIQQAIGWYLDWRWQGALDAEGVRLYAADEFTTAFSSLPIMIFVCMMLTFWLPKYSKK